MGQHTQNKDVANKDSFLILVNKDNKIDSESVHQMRGWSVLPPCSSAPVQKPQNGGHF